MSFKICTRCGTAFSDQGAICNQCTKLILESTRDIQNKIERLNNRELVLFKIKRTAIIVLVLIPILIFGFRLVLFKAISLALTCGFVLLAIWGEPSNLNNFEKGYHDAYGEREDPFGLLPREGWYPIEFGLVNGLWAVIGILSALATYFIWKV